VRFVLVHGGFHGAWCWDRLVPELTRRGHSTVTVDLPGHGARVDEDATLLGYRDAVVEVLEPGDILVGHSMGGFVVSLAADAAVDVVRHVVYLAGGLPLEGEPLVAAGAGIHEDERGLAETIEVIDDGRRMRFRTDAAAIDFFYHDCDADLARWACSRLTPEPLGPMFEPISIPRFWEAQLPRSLILCHQDHAGGDASAAARTVVRLGVEPFWMDTSHSPFLSQPAAVAVLLEDAAASSPVGPLLPR
jgi:pimeloyl-ACP methyl ester carboxylesterase